MIVALVLLAYPVAVAATMLGILVVATQEVRRGRSRLVVPGERVSREVVG